MRDGQFSNTRVVRPHVEPAEPTSASFVSSSHVEPTAPTSAVSVVSASRASASSSDQFSSLPWMSTPVAPQVLDAANSMHQQPSGTARLKRGGDNAAHASVKRACLGGPKRAKRGLKRTASDPVDAIDRLRAARSFPLH